jgi:hypothetical protein
MLVGRHITAGEGVQVGPDSMLGATYASPLYYYGNALLAAQSGSFWFGSVVNAVLQACAVLLLFLIGRLLGGIVVGFVVATVFACMSAAVDLSFQIWQPHIMHLVLLASLWAYVYAYRTTSHTALMTGASAFVVAVSIHMSALALLPAVLCATYALASRTQKRLQVFGAMTLVGLVLYAPVLWFHMGAEVVEQGALSRVGVSQMVLNLTEVPSRFIAWSEYVFRVWPGTPVPMVCALIVLLMGVYYHRATAHAPEQMWWQWVYGSLVSSLIIALIVPTTSADGYPVRYFIPTLPFVAIMLGSTLTYVRGAVGVWLVVCLCTYATLMHTPRLLVAAIPRVAEASFWMPPYVPDADIIGAYLTLHAAYPSEMAAGAVRFITIEGAPYMHENHFANDRIVNTMELYGGIPLVRLDASAYRSYVPRTDPRIAVVRCIAIEPHDCRVLFLEAHGTAYTDPISLVEYGTVYYLVAERLIQ